MSYNSGGRAQLSFVFYFKSMQKFCFHYQIDGKGLWKISSSNVKQANKKLLPKSKVAIKL